MRPSASAVLVAILCIVVFADDASARAASFGPGHEEEFEVILGSPGALSGGCLYRGTTMYDTYADARYWCPGTGEFTVEVIGRRDGVAAGYCTPRLCFVPSRIDPQSTGLVRDLLAVAGDAEGTSGAWWRDAARNASALHWVGAITLLVLAFSTLALAVRRRRDGVVPVRARDLADPRVAVASIAAVSLLVWSALRFRFLWDDFLLLARAESSPWLVEPSARLYSVSLHAAIGISSGHPEAWFAVSNVCMMLAGAALLAHLVGRAGIPGAAACLAGVAYAMAPGSLMQVGWFAGMQHLLANALLFCTLLAVDSWLGQPGGSRPSDGWLAALQVTALSAAGAMAKFASFVLVLPLTIVWARLAAPRSRPWKPTLMALAAEALGASIPLASLGSLSGSDDLHRASPEALLVNAAPFGLAMVIACAPVAAAAIAARAASPRDAGEAGAAGARSIRILSVSSLAAVVCAIPFLANGSYFMPYYPALSATAVSVGLLSIVERSTRQGYRRWVAALLVAASLVPWSGIRWVAAPSQENRVGEWLADLVEASGPGRPAHVHIVPDCGTPGRTIAARAELERWHGITAQSFGLRWAANWPDVTVTVEGVKDPGPGPSIPPDRVLVYCPGEGLRPRPAP